MKNNLRICSVVAFTLAVPALIVTDWYYNGYGLFLMFLLITIGLVCDQIVRMQFPSKKIARLDLYKSNKLLNIFAIILFVQSPMALVYGDKYLSNLGLFLMLCMICLGIILNQISRFKFNYKEGEI